jgi:hypothetical protein
VKPQQHLGDLEIRRKSDVDLPPMLPRSHFVLLIDQILTCDCMRWHSSAMLCRHIIAIVRQMQGTIPPHAIHIRWHKIWYNGLLTLKYHRTFLDGFQGFRVANTIQQFQDTFCDDDVGGGADVDVDDDHSDEDAPASQSTSQSTSLLSVSSTSTDHYHTLRSFFDDFQGHVIESVQHSSRATVWSLEFLKKKKVEFFKELTSQFPPTTSGAIQD